MSDSYRAGWRDNHRMMEVTPRKSVRVRPDIMENFPLSRSIKREEIDDESLSTISIAVSNQLLIVQYLYDFNFDGFKVLSMNDISKIGRGKVEEFHDKILISEGLIVKRRINVGYKDKYMV